MSLAKPRNIIPIVALGPGSPPNEDAPDLLLPRDIHRVLVPPVPKPEDHVHFEHAGDVIRRLVEALSDYQVGSQPGPRLELTRLDSKTTEFLNRTFLDGEVSTVLTSDHRTVKINETNFAGVWRLLHYSPGGELVHDYLEACPVPDAILQYALEASAAELKCAPPPPRVTNSPTVLFEIREQAAEYAPQRPAHVVNLTLLPLSAEDIDYLNNALPAGPVSILSQGYGKCRVSSTVLRNVWRVQYFNNMNSVILDTVEVVDIPEVVKAGQEDIEDTLDQLRELLDHWTMEPNARPAVRGLTEDPAPALERAYERIQREHMRDVPILNPAMRVEAIGFHSWQGHWIGILVTPWFMNAMVLPGSAADWPARGQGDSHAWLLPGGARDFIVGYNEDIGEYHLRSIMSPVLQFKDQGEARVAARAALDTLMRAPTAHDDPPGPVRTSAESANKPVSRRDFLFARGLRP